MWSRKHLWLASILVVFVFGCAGSSNKGQSNNAGNNAKIHGSQSPGLTWIKIPGGTFQMGSVDGDPDERPVHQVSVKSFKITKTEVTFAEYRACVKAGACTPAHVSDGTCWVVEGTGILPSSFQGDNQPVVCVDWNQAVAFARWAGGRLCTESEWEYAARSGGRSWKYPWGNKGATCERAVISDGGNGCGKNHTWPVCSKPKGNTVQGLCDMAGNVWEWVQDWSHGSYNGAPSDGSAWESPAGSTRVFRGGGWFIFARLCRSAYRFNYTPDTRLGDLGLRVCRSL